MHLRIKRGLVVKNKKTAVFRLCTSFSAVLQLIGLGNTVSASEFPGVSPGRFCQFPVSSRASTQLYKDTLLVSASASGEVLDRIADSCGKDGKKCRLSLRVFKSDFSFVGKPMRLTIDGDFERAVLASESPIHLPFNQETLTSDEFPGSLEFGDIPGDIHAVLEVDRLITGERVVTWMASSPVFSFLYANSFYDGKCVQDGFVASFSFGGESESFD